MKTSKLFLSAAVALVTFAACSKDGQGGKGGSDPVCTKVVATLHFGDVTKDVMDSYSFKFYGVDFKGNKVEEAVTGPKDFVFVGDGLCIDYIEGEKYPVTLGLIVTKNQLTKDSYSFQLNYDITFEYFDANGNKLKADNRRPYHIETLVPLDMEKKFFEKEMEDATGGMKPREFKFFRGGTEGNRFFAPTWEN